MWLNSDYLQFLILSSYANILQNKIDKKAIRAEPGVQFSTRARNRRGGDIPRNR